MKKWVPRQALEKGVYLEGVKTLKMITLTALLPVFYVAPCSQKGPQIEEKMDKDCTEGLKK